MAKKNKSRIPDAKMPDDQSELRRRAEEMLLKRHGEPGKISSVDVQRVVHDLLVHQIELEMQNDELRRTQQDLEVSREKYFDLYDLAPVGYVTLNEKGIILETNLTAVVLLGRERSDLVKQPLSRFIFGEDQDIYYLHTNRLFETRQHKECEVRMLKGDVTQFWARLEVVVIRGNNVEPTSRTTISDITKNKMAEEALKKAHDELERRVLERTMELSNLNNELKTEIEIRKRIEKMTA